MADRSIFLVAGEPSGDRLGAALMRGLPDGARFDGVGGFEMTAAGLRSRFDMSELTVMGLTEVLPRLPLLLRRIRETADAVLETNPDVLVTIDSPDFGLRVAARVRRARPDLPIVHYVAPSVWAWRPGRAKKMARHVDHVLALLPFEPPYMEAAGMSCDFVGHPAAAIPVPGADEVAAFRARHGLNGPLLLLAPGSRAGEVRRLMDDFRGAVERIGAQVPGLRVVIPVAETVTALVREMAPPDAVLIGPDDANEKRVAMAAADAALAASGTVVLELASVGTPMVAAYRTSWLTAAIVRRVVKVDTANLVNLIAGEKVVPEYLQEFCNPEVLAEAVVPLFGAAGDEQRKVFDRVLTTLGRGGEPPGARAARSVLEFLERQRRDQTAPPSN